MTNATLDQDVFCAISDPSRRNILDQLARSGATPALQLGKDFAGSQPALSKHLRVLRRAGLVDVQRVGRNQIYSLVPGPLAAVERWVSLYRSFWEERLDALSRHLDEQA